MAKEILCKALGRTCEPYDGEWADEPIVVGKNKATASAGGFGATIAQLGGQIEKASRNNEPQELIAVMKEVRKVLKKMQEEEE